MVGPAHRLRRRRDGGRHPPAARRWPTSSASSRSADGRPADQRVPGEAHRRRRACPTRPTRSTPRWATTSSPPTALVDAVSRGRRRTRPASTTWAATSSRCWSSAGEANVYDFRDNDVPGSTDRDRGYWRDVGTLDSFYEAHMDLIAIHPVFNLYNYEWPIYTEHRAVAAGEVRARLASERVGRAVDSMVSPGVVVSGSLVENSVVSPNVRVHSWAHVEGSVLMEGVDDRPARRGPQRHPRQERGRPRGRRDRRRPGARPARATPSPTAASSSSARASASISRSAGNRLHYRALNHALAALRMAPTLLRWRS